ncbi:hypothetical protein [Pseudomonas fluorescens]|uniref:hypothetical protein n=1 Tax=Pseudomonas fluorescens TaxID=294 RepID=UPI000937286F|nr:hypothetical protein [Pseudomonas fluorescens]
MPTYSYNYDSKVVLTDTVEASSPEDAKNQANLLHPDGNVRITGTSNAGIGNASDATNWGGAQYATAAAGGGAAQAAGCLGDGTGVYSANKT